jgi:succinoglycan biosynthesis protein ExoM
MISHHISVCICTFKRTDLLKRLLGHLENQETEGLFTYSVTVADNDHLESARPVVAAFSASHRLAVKYCVEPQENIALARNRAVEQAKGDFIAFIDDDEFPTENWLHKLFEARAAFGADGVLGPVKPQFETDPPRWVREGKFFERPEYPTGHRVGWAQSRTGNVLFRRQIINGDNAPFRSEFGTGGEDVDFFRRMAEKGCTFVWCNEAVVYEVVPTSRCKRKYLLKRALLRGSNSSKAPTHRLKSIAKSLIAVPCYTVALPILALFGQHVFLKYLIKLLDHTSKLFAYLGWKLVTEREM